MSSENRIFVPSQFPFNPLFISAMKLRSTLLFAAASLSVVALAPVAAVPAWAGTAYSSDTTISEGLTVDGTLSVNNAATVTQTAGTVSATRLILNDSKDEKASFYKLTGGVLNITGTEKAGTSTTTNAILVGHWHNGTSKLTVSGGVLNAVSGITDISWDSAGTLEISGGEVNLYGITLNTIRGNAANVTLSDGRLNLGAGGLTYGNGTNSTSNKTVTLSGGTLGALEDWSSSVAISITDSVAIDTTKMSANTTGKATTTSSGATITLSGNITQTAGTLTVSGAGTLDLSGATVSLVNAITNEAKVTVNSNTIFVLKDSLKSEGSGVYTLISGGTITNWNSSTLSLSNFRHADGAAFSSRSSASITTSGSVTISEVVYNLFWKGGTSGTWNTTDATVWGKDSSSGENTAFATGDNVTFNSTDAVAVAVDSSGVTAETMTVSAGTVTLSGGKVTTTRGITISGTGTLKISANTNIGGNVTVGSGGTFDFNGSASDIGEKGLGTITLAGGKLTNTGTGAPNTSLQFFSLAVSADSEVGGSGNFGLIARSYAATTLDLGGHTLTKTGTNNFWLVNTTVSAGTLKISEGAVNSVGTRINGSETDFVIEENGTLNMGAGTLSAKSISGAGTVYFSGAGALSAKPTFNSWTGTVKIVDKSANNFTLSNYGASGSTIELSGYSGYFSEQANGTVAANIKLTNSSTADHAYAAQITNGNSNNTIAFSGNISGNGLFYYSHATAKQICKFTGNLSDFTGTLKSTTATFEFAGASDQTFNGSIVGNDTTGAKITKSGSTKLTLAGTNTSINASTLTVSAGTLEISAGTITLANAIANSGTVTVGTGAVFVLADTLKSDEAYRLINGGTIDGWNDTTLSISNFRKADGSAFSERSTVDVSVSGVVKINEVLADLYWKGGTSGTWDTTEATKTNWGLNSTTGEDTAFVTGDNVTFSTSDATITLGEAISAGTVTVTENTTITATETNTLKASAVAVTSGTLTLAGQQYVTAGSIDIAEGATLDLGSLATGVSVSQKLTGTGAVSFTSTHGNTINLGTEFAGTVNISGNLQLKDASFGASTATLNLMTGVHLWSQYSCAPVIEQAINFKSGQSKIGGWGSATSSITLSGDLTFEDGASLYVANASGTSTAVPVVLNISGTMTNATISQDGGTLNISGVASLVGYKGSSGATNSSVLNVASGASLAVSGDMTLRYEHNNANGATLNVSGGVSVDGNLWISRDGKGFVNINDGGSVTAGTLTFGQRWADSSGTDKTSVVNVASGGMLIAGAIVANTDVAESNADILKSSALNLNGGTLGTTADTLLIDVKSGSTALSVVLGDGTTSTINTGKYDAAAKTFTETGASITIANVISGSGALNVAGAGTLTLSGANTFTGGVTISAGTLIATQNAALGDASGAIAIEENGTLELGSDFGSTFSRTVSGTGTLATNADFGWTAGTDFSGSFNVKGGTFTLTANADSSFKKLSASAGTAFKANQNIAFASVESFAGTLSGASSSTRVSVAEGSFAGTLNTVALVKTGTGTLDMNGATFAAGGSLIVEGGTVSNLTLSGGGTLTFNTTAEASATMSNLTIYGGTKISITESFADIATALLTDTLTLTNISGDSKLTLEFSNIAVSYDYQVFTFTSAGKIAWEAAFGTLTESGKFSGGNLTLSGIATDASGKFAWAQNTDGTYTLKFRENRAAETFYWRGNGENPAWDEASNWSPSAFVAGSAAVFDKDSLLADGTASVIISSSVAANSVTVDLLTDASEGAKGELTISQWDDAATMLVHNGITVKTGVLNFVASSEEFYTNAFIIEKDGELNLGNGVKDLALKNKFSGEGVVRHKSTNRTLTLSGDRTAFTGTLDVQAGTVVLANTTGEENFEIALAKTVKDEGTVEGTVEITGGKTTSAGDIALTLEKVSGAGTLAVSGGASLDSSKFYDLEIKDGESFTGTLKLTNANVAVVDRDSGVQKSTFGNASLIVVENSELNFMQKGGADAVFSKNVEIGTSGGKIRVYADNGDGATFAGKVSGSGALTITGSREATDGAAGKIAFTGTSFEVDSLTVTGGEVAINVDTMNIAGDVSLAGTAATLAAKNGAIGGDLTAETAGTLTLGGTLKITGDLVRHGGDWTETQTDREIAVSTGAEITVGGGITFNNANKLMIGDNASMTVNTFTAAWGLIDRNLHTDETKVGLGIGEDSTLTVSGEMSLTSGDGLARGGVIAGTGTSAGTLKLGSLTVGSNAEYLFRNLNIAITGNDESVGITNSGTIKLQNVVISAAGENTTGWSSASNFLLNGGTTTFNVAEDKTITLSGTIAEAVATGTEGETSSELVKTGAGTLKLTQANTNAGGTTVSAGTLEYALADGTAFAQNVTVEAGALRFAASTTTDDTTTVGGTVNVGSELNFSAGSTLTAATGTTIKIAENGSLTGDITFSSEGTSSTRSNLTFATDCTIAAGDSLTLNDGVASIASDKTLTIAGTLTLGGTQSWTTVDGDGTLKLDGGTLATNTTMSGLSVSAAVEFAGESVINTEKGNLTLKGEISGAADAVLTKNGSGRLTFVESIGDFAGSLVVNAGTVALSNNDVLENAKELTIASGATFSGNVTMASGGDVSIASGAQLTGNVEMTGGTFALESGTLTGNAKFTNSDLTFGENVDSGAAKSSTIFGNLAVSGSVITLRGDTVSTGYFDVGTGNTITLSEAFGKSISGTQTLIDFSSSNLANVDVTKYINFTSGTESYGRRRLSLSYNATNTSLDVSSTGTLIWNKNVGSWGVSSSDLWTFEDDTSTSGTTTFEKNDYVMFTEAGSVSLAETTINSSGVVFDLDGAFTIGLADGITNSELTDADAGANAGLSIFKGDVTFAEGVHNSMTGGIYLSGGSLTVYSANALGSIDDYSAAGLFLEGGTLNFVKNEDTETIEFTALQKVTLGVVDAASTSAVDVAEKVSVTFTKAFKKASETYDANLTKTGKGSLSISRESEIDLLRVSAGTVTLTGDSTANKLGVKSVYVAGKLKVEQCDYIGGNAAFTTVELSDGTLDLTDGGAFRAGTLYGKGTVDGTLAVGEFTETFVNTTGTLTLTGVRIYEGTVYTSSFLKMGLGTLKIGGTLSSSVRFDRGTIETASGMLGTLTASGADLVFRNTGSANSTNAISGGVHLIDGAGITFVNSNAKATMGITGVSIAEDGNASTTFTTGSFEIAGTSANFGSGATSRLTISSGTNVTVSAGTFTAGVLSLNKRSKFVLGSNNTSATVTAITVDATANAGATIDLSADGGKTLTVEGVNGVAVLGSGVLTVIGVAGDLDAGKLVVNGHDGYVSTGGMDIVLSNASLAFNVGDGTSSWASISSITTKDKTSGVVEKSGAGTLSIASEEDSLAFDGTIKVSEGTLRIGSRMTKAEVYIEDGATLTFFGSAATAVDGKVNRVSYNAPLANSLTGAGTLAITGSLLTNRDGSENSGLENFNGTIAADGSAGAGYIFSGAALAEWEKNGSSRDVELRNGGTLVFGGTDETTANTLKHLSVNGRGILVGNARGTVVDTFTQIDATAGSSLRLEGSGIIGGMTFADETDDDGARVAGTVFLSGGAEWTFAGTNTGLIDINILESSLIVTSAKALAEEGTSIVVMSSSLTFAGVSATFANSNIGLIGDSDAHSEIIATDSANVTLTGTLGAGGSESFADFTANDASTLTLPESALSFVSTFTVEDADSTISVAVDSAQTLEAGTRVLSGAGTFEKTGAGTLSVSGDAGTIGTLAVSAGTVSFDANSKLAAATAGAGTLSVADGATLNLAAGTDLSGFTLSGTGAVEINANSSNSAKLAGMSGATAVSLTAGTLQIGGNVSDSKITFASGTALETTGEKSVVSGTTLAGTSLKLISSGTANYESSVTLDDATALTLQAAKNTTGTFAAAYAGNLEKTGDGTWTVSNYSFGASDGQELTVSAGTLIWEKANFGTAASKLTVDGILQIASLASGNELNTTIHGSGILNLANCGSSDTPFEMNATAVSGATWALYLSGTSYVEMAKALPGDLFITNTAAGVLNVDSGEKMEMGASNRVIVTKEARLVKTGAGTLTFSEVKDKHTLGGTLDIQGGTVVQSGDIVWSGGTLNIESGATFEVNTSSTKSFNKNGAKLTGAGTINIVNAPKSEYTLGGELNDFTGTVNVGSGTTLVLTRETLENATETAVAGMLRVAISGKTARTLNNLSGAGTLIIDAPQTDSTIPYAVHNWGDGNTFAGSVQVKNGILSISAGKLDDMTASVTIGGDNAAKYGEKGTSSGILQGGFLRVTGDSDEIDVADKIFGTGKYSFTSKGGLLLSGGAFGINADSGTAGLFVTENGANLHLRNGADINGSVFVARGTEMFVGETSTSSGDEETLSLLDAGTPATSENPNSSISGNFTLNGALTICVTDNSLAAGTPLLGVGGNVALDADSGSAAEIVLNLSGTSVSLDSVAVTILGGTLTGDTSALDDLVTVTDSTGTEWPVSRDANGHLVLRNTATEYKNPPKGLRELFAAVKNTVLGDFIQSDFGKSEERLVALSPVSFGALLEMQSGFASLENDLLRERLEQRRYERAIVGNSSVKFKPFVNVFGSDRKSDGNGTESANYDMTHAGVFGGFDTAISSNTIFGVSVGLDWAKARLHDGAGKHTGDGSRLGIYGMSQFANAYVGYGLSAGGMSFETKRNTGYNNESVTGETDGNDVNASFLFGAGWTLGSGVDFAPFAGVDIGYARTKSFSEKDGNVTALDVEKAERWSLRGKVGAALNWRATDSLRFGIEASFAHEFLDTEADIDAAFASGSVAGTKFTSTAYLMDENTIQIGPRVDCRIDETWSLSAAYTFETDLADTTTHSANFGLRARF